MTTFIIPRDEVPAGQEAHFFKFVCPPRFDGGPFDAQPASRKFRCKLAAKISLNLPASVANRTRTGRDKVDLWVIENPDAMNGKTFPSPIIRTVQGDTVHVTAGFSFNAHTIHWHGIEPTPLNDGVGHTSFEATSEFVYQFATNTAGTYFYHCHKNTVLHVELGMYGALVVDPPNPDPADPVQAPYRTGGPGLVRANLDNFPGFPKYDASNFLVRYDVEALWVPDEFDSLWHELGHDAYTQSCDETHPMASETFTRDGILNDFRPDVFVVSGAVSAPETPPGIFPEIGAVIRDPSVAIIARKGETILIRLVNAGYTIQEYSLGLDAIVIATDGHSFGVPPTDQYSFSFALPAGQLFRLTSGRRIDLLVRASGVGEFPFEVRYYDWVHGPDSQIPRLFHIAKTVIRVL